MKGAASAPEERRLAFGPSPAVWYGANSDTSRHANPVGPGCIRGADGMERHEFGAKARGHSRHRRQKSSLMTHLFR